MHERLSRKRRKYERSQNLPKNHFSPIIRKKQRTKKSEQKKTADQIGNKNPARQKTEFISKNYANKNCLGNKKSGRSSLGKPRETQRRQYKRKRKHNEVPPTMTSSGQFSLLLQFFLVSGVVPSLLMLNPNHSICLQANIHFSSEIARFSSSSLSKTAFSSCWCNSVNPIVTISISSKHAYVFVQFVKIRSMAFWNSAGISVRP